MKLVRFAIGRFLNSLVPARGGKVARFSKTALLEVFRTTYFSHSSGKKNGGKCDDYFEREFLFPLCY